MKRTALVTGASVGIGYEFCRLFAAHGHDLVLVSRNEDRLNVVAEELRSAHTIKTRVLPADLADPKTPKRVFDTLTSEGIEIEYLVNNAGFGMLGPFQENDEGGVLELVQVNITSLVYLTRLFLPGMKERGSGRILNVASTAAFQPGPWMSIYYATKAFVLSFSEALWSELRTSGVDVTCLCPGPTQTEFMKRAGMDQMEFVRKGHPFFMSAQRAARAGYGGMMKGKRVVIPGISNRMGAVLSTLLPNRVVLAAIRKMQKTTN